MYQTFQILHCTLKCSGLKEVDYDPDKAILSGFLLALIPIPAVNAMPKVPQISD